MQNIFDIYNFFKFVTDKSRQGYLAPTEVSTALDTAQQSFYRYCLPLYLEQGDDYASTALSPFKQSVSLTSSSTGLLTYPNDWGNTEAIYETINGVLTVYNTVMHVELQDALASVLYPIETNPRYIEEATGTQLYPANTHTVSLHYLSKPTTPVIGFTVVGNDIVYDPLASVQLQFSNQYWMQIIQKALPYIGVNLSDQEVTSLSSLFYNENAVTQ